MNAAARISRRRLIGRLSPLALGIVCLIGGIWAGMARLGIAGADIGALHGPLMVSGFFGTLIGLERAVAIGRPWGFAAPLAAGTGGAVLLLGAPEPAGAALMLIGSLVLTAVSAAAWRRQPDLPMAVLAAAVICWAAGNALWLGGAASPDFISWWILFLVLTIAAERLELTRFLPAAPGSRGLFAAILAALVLGAALGGSSGGALFGGGALALALWLMRFDIARRTVGGRGLTRYVAICLLGGYVWLGAGGLLTLLLGDAAYGAALHAIMLGFVFVMAFGHAPIILPAVLRISLPFRPALYGPLLLLHVSLAARVAGNLLGWTALWQWGGIGNGAALLLFALLLIGTAGRPVLAGLPFRRRERAS